MQTPVPRTIASPACPWLCWLCLALALGGCATAEQSAERHTDANRVQAEAMNQQLLLNIVRAREGEAMHYSRIPEVALPLPVSTLNSLAIPFGIGTNAANTFTTQVGAPATSAKVVPQDSQEFMQGILQPVSPTLMGFYLDQGWPKRLVLSLFIEQIVVYAEDGKRSFFDGHPRSARRAEFYQLLDALAKLRPTVVRAREPEESRHYGPALPASAFETPAGLAALRNAGLELKRVKDSDRFQVLTPATTTPRLAFGRDDCLGALGQHLRWEQPATGEWASFGTFASDGTAPQRDEGPRLEMTLRSPAAMIHYLGELARQQPSTGAIDWKQLVCPGENPSAAAGFSGKVAAGDKALLFPMNLRIADAGSATEAAAGSCTAATTASALPPAPVYVSVAHRGCRYTVQQESDDDRTSQAMRLVGEVLQLQYKGLAAPTTVRVQLP